MKTWAERRAYLRDQFEPLLSKLRDEISPSLARSNMHESPRTGDQFRYQFPAGLPFGTKKPSLAFLPKHTSQEPHFEDELGIGVLRENVYPNLTYQKLKDNLERTPIGTPDLISTIIGMCQTGREKDLLNSYADKFDMGSQNIPVLVPQAWIQWHSRTKPELRANATSYADDPYRVDFVAFWADKRFAILVDDISHYAKRVGDRWDADEKEYSKRLKEDRKLRREAWQVFRVSNWEMKTPSFVAEILMDLKEYFNF